MTNKQLAYFLARITLGVNLFIHGLVRIPKLGSFAEGVIAGFEKSMLAEVLVMPFAYAIPILEVAIGAVLIMGFKTRKSLVAAALLILLLIAGSAFKEDWGAVGTQMLYALYIFFLIFNLEHDKLNVGKNKN